MKVIIVSEDEYEMIKRIRDQREQERKSIDNPVVYQWPPKIKCRKDECKDCNCPSCNPWKYHTIERLAA